MRIRPFAIAIAPAIALALTLPTIPAHAQNSSASTQPKRPITFNDLMAFRRISDPQPSPDGKWVMFSVQDVDLARNKKITHLWIAPADGSGGNNEKPLTASAAGESRGRFSPDGSSIVFTSAMDGGTPQLFLAPFNSANGTIGDSHKLTTLSTGADGSLWSPDSKQILFLSEVYPDCGANDDCNKQRDLAAEASKVKALLFTHLLYRHWNAYLNDKRSHIFVINADGTNVRDLTPASNVGDHEVPTFSLGGADDYDWSPDSKEVAYVADLDPVPAISTSKQIYSVRLDNLSAKPRKISTSAGGNFTPRYSPDGKWIAFRSQARAGYESDRFRLALYNRDSYDVSYPLPEFDRWIDEIAWGPDSIKFYFSSGDSGEEAFYQTQVSFWKNAHRITDVGDIGELVVSKDGRFLFGSGMTVRSPAAIYSVHADQQRVALDFRHGAAPLPGTPWYANVVRDERGSMGTQVSHLNDALLAQLDLPAMDSFWFTGALATKVQGFIIRPPGFDPAKKYPVKFLIHGGPQGAWGQSWSYRWNAEYFAANGYVVIMINPRGSTGYGQAFIDGINGDWGGKPFTDLMRGLDYAETTYPFIDKSRECALGASYGGYMADWVLGHTHRFVCIVTHDGMFDPISAYGTTEELWFNEWEFKGKPWDYFDKPAALDPYRRWSPMLATKNFKTPTLVVHGQLDYRLDLSQGLALFTTLQRLNIPSEMLYFPDEGHWVGKPQNSQLWYKTVNAWCDEWTGSNGATPPAPPVSQPPARPTPPLKKPNGTLAPKSHTGNTT